MGSWRSLASDASRLLLLLSPVLSSPLSSLPPSPAPSLAFPCCLLPGLRLLASNARLGCL